MYKNNLEKIRLLRCLDRQQLAEKIGVTSQAIGLIERGERGLSGKMLEKLSIALNCTKSQLLGERGWEEIKTPSVITIKKYNVKASAGDGLIDEGEDGPAEISFEKGFLGLITGSRPDHLNIIKVEGNSMYPTLKQGDLILVDKSNITIENGGIFVIRMGGLLKVKRVIANLFKKNLRIISDNDDKNTYPDYEISFDDAYDLENMEIIGKVVWSGATLP